ESAGASLSSASAWLAAARGGRGRRDADAPFRMCGTALLTHVMTNICNCRAKRKSISRIPNGSAVLGSRVRRATDSKKISNMCCVNECRPSEIKAICC
ncbi:hypothetical protein PMAYCL1PPCAC_08576, partial [Pristionchus mayeri]